MKDFLCIRDNSPEDLKELLAESIKLKKLYKKGGQKLCLTGKSIVMFFEKPSLRTRVSFQVAVTDLGASTIYVQPEDIGGELGKREPIKDMARVLERYAQAIVTRTFAHDTVIELAKFSSIPVINALTDWAHPCQAMADIMTIQEHLGELKGVKIAFIGDGNNVARSLAFACAKLGLKMVIAAPPGYELDSPSISAANKIKKNAVEQINDPNRAITAADIIYTDTWVSMGQENEKQKRIEAFKSFQINDELLKNAPKCAKIMHCLPAYRGYEISDEVMESENSIIFDQAENRLHFQRALLKKLMT